jgi:hypothetical protein
LKFYKIIRKKKTKRGWLGSKEGFSNKARQTEFSTRFCSFFPSPFYFHGRPNAKEVTSTCKAETEHKQVET